MDIYNGLEVVDEHKNVVMALGNFDGVHLGHRKLIRTSIEIASQQQGTPAVFTFDPHPMKVIHPDCSPSMLLSKEDKISMLSELGIKLLIICPFSKLISNLSPEEFVKNILIENFHVQAVVIGYNYNFGHRGVGNAELLKRLVGQYGVAVKIVPPVKLEGREVSSTIIRKFLAEGNVCDAARFLSYNPFVKSKVTTGEQRGRQIGFPTANLNLNDEILLPANGVYAVKVYIKDNCYYGVANMGVKPTFGCNLTRNLEIHLFEFSEDIYGQDIKVEFLNRIRCEQQFESVNELKLQIKRDITDAKKALNIPI